ncbi:uncharacterized protein [Haliotis cracherodii]|uniref:uncharacterized protein n=1 Tax=Haliotis cracherodii TaxID=6455 RepID=UPI0039EC226C
MAENTDNKPETKTNEQDTKDVSGDRDIVNNWMTSYASMATEPPKGENLEDLLSTLQKQIKGSDWLKENTAEKWTAENKELAEEFMKAKECKEKKADS